ncbi:hypothetical protein Taro_053971 [Colocasia esculenta]|uniref:Uncharacterized protein n=1 Tax=Colocasia esculenta TaxID=4460 RepID=A0A843XP69_COLES|nr:hypothetical protein [Colocasia esculenta]
MFLNVGEIACKTMYQNKSKKIKKSTKDKYLSIAPKMSVDSPAQTDLIGYWQGVPVDSPTDVCRQICTGRTHRLLASIDTGSSSVDTGSSSVDMGSSSVDTRDLPRKSFVPIWDSVSIVDQVVSTLEAFPENI